MPHCHMPFLAADQHMSVIAVELESCQHGYLWGRRMVGAPLAGSAGVVQHLLQAGWGTALSSQSLSPLLKAGGTGTGKHKPHSQKAAA